MDKGDGKFYCNENQDVRERKVTEIYECMITGW